MDNIFKRTINRITGNKNVENRTITVAPTNSFGLPYGFPSSPFALGVIDNIILPFNCEFAIFTVWLIFVSFPKGKKELLILLVVAVHV